jgi:hypothetical protein
METVKLYFYKASWLKIVDAIISGWTLPWNIGTPSTSHVEIGFKSSGGYKCYSSTTRNRGKEGENVNGTRWISEKDLLKHPERWIILEKKYPESQVNAMIERCHEIEGLPYDWCGIFGFATITGQLINDKDKWYCSEAVNYVLTGQWNKRISPRRFYRKAQKLGFTDGIKKAMGMDQEARPALV